MVAVVSLVVLGMALAVVVAILQLRMRLQLMERQPVRWMGRAVELQTTRAWRARNRDYAWTL